MIDFIEDALAVLLLVSPIVHVLAAVIRADAGVREAMSV